MYLSILELLASSLYYFYCLLKVIWSIENIKQQITRNITLMTLLMNPSTLYGRK